MNEKYCQSCGMPLGDSKEVYGTEKDGSLNEDYCIYCYADGAFTSDVTMDEMIEVCVPHMSGANSKMSEDEARKMMKEYFPTLKRWQ